MVSARSLLTTCDCVNMRITTYTRFAESFEMALQNVQCKVTLLLAIIDKAITVKADDYGLRMY